MRSLGKLIHKSLKIEGRSLEKGSFYLGSINDMISLTECRIEEYLPTEEMNILELNQLNNRTPLLMLEKTFAINELKAVWG